MPLSHPDADLAAYHRHLTMLRAWLTPLQAWLDTYNDGPQNPDLLPPRDFLALIAADLHHAEPAATAPWRPSVQTPAYRWGICYVIEGSQLGGAVLHRRLAARLAPHPLSYLRGDPEGPGPRWQAFLRALRTEVTSEDAIEQACQGARDAFDSLLALRAARQSH